MVSRPLVSIAERVRKEWFELVSRKITGWYTGWIPCFIVLPSAEKGRSITKSKPPLALELQVAVHQRDRQPVGLDVEGDDPGGGQAAEAPLPQGQVLGGGGVGDGAVEAVYPCAQGPAHDRLAQRREHDQVLRAQHAQR